MRLNSVPVIRDADIIDHSGGTGIGIDFLVNFEVINGGKTLVIFDQPVTEIVEGTMDLSFCLSPLSPGPGRDFLISAFSFVKFTDARKISKNLYNFFNFQKCQLFFL